MTRESKGTATAGGVVAERRVAKAGAETASQTSCCPGSPLGAGFIGPTGISQRSLLLGVCKTSYSRAVASNPAAPILFVTDPEGARARSR